MKKGSMRRAFSLLLSFVLVLSMCFISIPKEVKAAENVAVIVNADKTELRRGDTVTYTVELTGNESVVGADVGFSYDSDMLELQGEPTKGNCFDGVFVGQIVSSNAGVIKAVLGMPAEDPISNGTIFTAQFKVKDTAKGNISTGITGDMTNVIYELVPYTVTNNASSVQVVVPATGISLNKQELTLAKGNTEALTATLKPADASQTIAWSSNNEDVATVDQSGNVTAIGKGNTIITAKAGEYTAECKVTVNIPLNDISIKSTADTIKKGQTAQLSIVYNPEDTTDDKSVTWSSTGKYATVNQNGLVTAVKDGEETITAKVGDKTATYKITVKEIKLVSISVKPETTVHRGETETLEVTYNPTDTTDDRTVTWASSDTKIVTVDGSGTLTAVAPGSAIVTAKVGNAEAKCTVTVDAPLQSIVPDKDVIDMVKNQTGTITYTFNPTDTTDSKEVTFSSSNTNVVEVNTSTGELKALKEGSAVITITGVNDITAEVTVNVTEIPIDTVVLDANSKVIEKGSSAEIHATIEPENNTDDDQTITWNSSDEAIATVAADATDSSKAVITVPADSKGGKVTITATAWNGTSASCEVTVPIRIESIALPKNVTIMRGATKILEVTYNPENTTDDKAVTWTSSDTSIATVDENTGMITGIKEGNVKITAATKVVNAATGNPYTAETTVTIKENHLTDELAETITFEKMESSLLKGQTIDLSTLLNLKDILVKNGVTDEITIEWSSKDEDVATIDQSGKALGITKGKTTITAAIKATDGNGNSKEYKVDMELEVKEIPLESIAFDKVITEMQTGASDTLKVIYNPADTTDVKDVVWTSSDDTIISVEAGTIKALKAGVAEITASVGDKKVTCKITVKDAETPQNPSNTTSQGNEKGGNSNGKSIKTGDTANVMLYVVLLLGAIATILVTQKRKKYRGN